MPGAVHAMIRYLEDRLVQHRGNLAGWRERSEAACGTRTGELTEFVREPRIGCLVARGHYHSSIPAGYLVPTEPDPDERVRVRAALRGAIAEAEAALVELRDLTGEGRPAPPAGRSG